MPKGYPKNGRLAYSPRRHKVTPNFRRRYNSLKNKGVLTKDQTMAFEMFHDRGLTEYEIADQLDISQPMVSVLLKNVRAVVTTGRPTMYYRRRDSISRKIPWGVCHKHRGALGNMMMDILRRRHRDHQTTASIAEEVGLTQPQVSTILTACSVFLQNETTEKVA
jgi:predicted transcriptional regulator